MYFKFIISNAFFMILYSLELQALMSDGYIGCFEDSLERILNGKPIILRPNSGRRCKAYCRQKRYRYAGTESGEECFCGHFLREKILADSCDDECEGNPSEICGGHWRISIYDTWFCAVLPCKNGATCMDIDANSYKCICPYGWIGKRCEKALMSDGYIGCFEDSLERILNGKPIILRPNSGRRCKAYCRQKRYRYAGTESGEECFCGHFLREKRLADSCDDECEGNPSEICGGHWRISIYDTWFCAVLPCKNGATCMDIDANSYKCICPYGWIGKRCEKEKTTTSSSSATATVPKTTRSVYMSSAENRVSTSTATSTNMADVQYINSNAATSYQTNMLAYIIVPIALVLVGVIVIVLVVVVIKKRRQQRNGDDPYHIYCEPDVSGMTNLSPQLTNSQDASTEGKPKTANIQECQHTKQHVAGEESKSYMVTSDNTYANREAINAKAMQSEWYEMLQQNRGSGSGYTAIDLHGARHSGERNYEVLNKDNVSDDDYLKLHFSM